MRNAPPEGKRIHNRAPVHVSMYESVCLVAREHGYAIGLHGSMVNDLDLIAVPWIDQASPAIELVRAVRDALGGSLETPGAGAPRDEMPTRKPHGRLAWSVWVRHLHVDLSVMPLGSGAVSPEPEATSPEPEDEGGETT